MPTYDYECTHCGHQFEAFQKITEAALSKCPECGHKLKRLIGSGSGIIFKGSGFYATDYRKKTTTSTDNKQGKASPQESRRLQGLPVSIMPPFLYGKNRTV